MAQQHLFVLLPAGGEGATAREVLRHKSVEKVVMVDIDKVVCDFCHAHLEHNKAAFESPRLELINDDAQAQLEQYPGKFDVIIGDLADPLEDGPCYQLYTQVDAPDIFCKHDAAHITPSALCSQKPSSSQRSRALDA